ncbi:hypothetical protein VSR82_32785 [Burkholderia sp. JPY481]
MNQLRFGKSGADLEYFYGVVSGGGAYGPGICEKIVGMSERGELITKRLALHDDRSGSKRSGSVNYALTGDGVYRAYGYAQSNRSEGPEVFFELVETSLVGLDRQELAERLRTMSPQNFAKVMHARQKGKRRMELLPQVQAEVDELTADGERLEVTEVSVNDQLELNSFTVTRYKPCGHFGEIFARSVDGLVARLSEPTGPCTYCEALAAKARATADAIQSLQVAAAARNLPELSGSPRQIKWALEIRQAFSDKNPTSPLLKRATTAKYWIEHRNGL